MRRAQFGDLPGDTKETIEDNKEVDAQTSLAQALLW